MGWEVKEERKEKSRRNKQGKQINVSSNNGETMLWVQQSYGIYHLELQLQLDGGRDPGAGDEELWSCY
jgi:hypothetical protein